MIYSGSPVRHLPGLAAVVKEKLNANWRCLYLNSPPMVAEMRLYLAEAGVAVAEEVERGALVLSASQDHLQEGGFEVDQMLRTLTDAVNQALSDGYAGLWATGDMAWEFGNEKNFAKLQEYEYALESLFAQQPAFSGICQYHMDTLPADVVQWGLCTHRSVYINETRSEASPCYQPAGILTYRRPFVSARQLEEMLASPVQSAEAVLAAGKQ